MAKIMFFVKTSFLVNIFITYVKEYHCHKGGNIYSYQFFKIVTNKSNSNQHVNTGMYTAAEVGPALNWSLREVLKG